MKLAMMVQKILFFSSFLQTTNLLQPLISNEELRSYGFNTKYLKFYNNYFLSSSPAYSGAGHNLIFWGINDTLRQNLFASPLHQIAVVRQDIESLEMDELFQKYFHPKNQNGGLTTIHLIFPSGLDKFYEILDKITVLYKMTGLMMRQSKNSGQLFFVSMPPFPGAKKMDTNNNIVKKIVSKMPQNAQTYIFHHLIPPVKENGTKFSKFKPFLFEVYGIQGSVGVIEEINSPNFDGVSVSRVTELISFGSRRKNFQNVTIKVMGQHDPDYAASLDVNMMGNNDPEFVGGAGFYILKDFQDTLNFRYKSIAGEGWIGQKNEKSLTGMGRQIIFDDVDISLSASTIVEYRAKHIQFLPAILTEQPYVFFRQPPVSEARNIFTMPFNKNLWWGLLVIWIMLGASFFLVICSTSSGKFLNNNRLQNLVSNNLKKFYSFLITDVFIWAMGIFCQQGVCLRSSSLTCIRILVINGLLTSIITYIIYTAALVAVISNPLVPVRHYMDLAKYQIVTFVDPLSIFASSFISNEREELELKKRSEKLYQNEPVSVDKVMGPESKLAFIITPDSFYATGLTRYSEPDLCRIHSLKGRPGLLHKSAMFMRKGSDVEEFFVIKTIQLLERGLNNRYWMEYKLKTKLRCLKKSAKIHRLNFMDSYAAFIILVTGNLLAMCILMVERLKGADGEYWIQ